MLVGIVSSERLTDKSSIRTMSGLAWVVLMVVGVVAGGDSVSSKRLTDKSSIRTMSGLAWVVLMLIGVVAGGDSEALHVEISVYRWAVAGSISRTIERRQFRTESCLHL